MWPLSVAFRDRDKKVQRHIPQPVVESRTLFNKPLGSGTGLNDGASRKPCLVTFVSHTFTVD